MDSKCQPALVSSPLLDFLLFQNLLTSLLPLVSPSTKEVFINQISSHCLLVNHVYFCLSTIFLIIVLL